MTLIIDYGEPEPDGRLRLAGGNSPSSGRLEILKNGLWGTVCSVGFDKADGDVACKELGYNQSVRILEKLVDVWSCIYACLVSYISLLHYEGYKSSV